MRKKITTSIFFAVSVIIFVIAATGNTHSAEISERFQARVYKSKKYSSLPFRLLVPVNYDRSKKYPVILFFHGADERGNDTKKHLHFGLNILADENRMKRYPCFIVAPQCPVDEKWVEVDWKASRHTMNINPAPPLAMSIELVKELQKEFSIDSGMIYVTGYSMGGFGAWEAIQRWPDFFAAAVPVCGGGDIAQAQRLVNIPIWAFHGALDNLVKVTRTRDMIKAIARAGGTPRYTEYATVSHPSWTYAFGDEALIEWLFKQKK